MAMSFYSDEAHLFVDNPGYGELAVQWKASKTSNQAVAVTGPRLTMMLEQLTHLAMGVSGAPRTLLPPGFDQAGALGLLPVFQRAVILATAGTDRYESLYPSPEGGPRPPICVNCGINGGSTSDDARFSGWCLEHGHTPFGSGSGTSWEQAVTRYETQRSLWESRQRRD